MDEATEHKIRDLRLRILKIEKEIAASKHNVNLGAWLRAGHASQMAKQGEREQQRLESKLEDLKAKLAELAPSEAAASAPEADTKTDEQPAAPKKKTAAERPATAKKKK